jgi:tetratricopeptide (TPR) repeat protein
VKKPQLITLAAGLVLVTMLYFFGRIIPKKAAVQPAQNESSETTLTTDSVLAKARRRLTSEQFTRLSALENSVSRGDVKEQQLKVFHQLAHFWLDSAGIFEPYALYEAEAARLENSEKTLTFAAHLFLENLRGESNLALKTWKAVQSRDLFERSLKINPNNDSSAVGLGAVYIFGSISATPMEGISRVRAVVDRDSTNLFAQEVLGHGSMLSGQFDKAISRFETVYRLSNNNASMKLQASLMLAEAYENKGDAKLAIDWYEKSLPLMNNLEMRNAVRSRINALKKT